MLKKSLCQGKPLHFSRGGAAVYFAVLTGQGKVPALGQVQVKLQPVVHAEVHDPIQKGKIEVLFPSASQQHLGRK